MNKRVNEILNQITAFSNEKYTKDEYLDELLKLQREMVNLTFNDEHAGKSNLRLKDVRDHFKSLNDENGGTADDELNNFTKMSKDIENEIRAEISGNKGERIAFDALDQLSCYHATLHNVELADDNMRTEIDAIVFTHKAVFIIEVKNTKKNIFIDEDGGFYRLGQSMNYDSNIAEKMSLRESMLRNVLDKVGLGYLKIFSIVTFTNTQIDVENKYHRICVCPINYLNFYIEKFQSKHWYTEENIGTMVTAVEDAKCKDQYHMFVDVSGFKNAFVTLMEKLEDNNDCAVPNSCRHNQEKEEITIIGNQGKKILSWVERHERIILTLMGPIGLPLVIVAENNNEKRKEK